MVSFSMLFTMILLISYRFNLIYGAEYSINNQTTLNNHINSNNILNLVSSFEMSTMGTSISNINSLIMNGNGYQIDGNLGNYRILEILNSNNIVINSLTFKNGTSTSSGGAIWISKSMVTFIKCSFISNSAVK